MYIRMYVVHLVVTSIWQFENINFVSLPNINNAISFQCLLAVTAL